MDPERNARIRMRAIGRRLREDYAVFAAEPIPQEFLVLLKEIDQAAAERARRPEGDKWQALTSLDPTSRRIS